MTATSSPLGLSLSKPCLCTALQEKDSPSTGSGRAVFVAEDGA